MSRKLAAFEMILTDSLTISSPVATLTDIAGEPDGAGQAPGIDQDEIRIEIDNHHGWAAISVWLCDATADADELPLLHAGPDGLVVSDETGVMQQIEVPPGGYAIDVEQRFDADDRLHFRIVLTSA